MKVIVFKEQALSQNTSIDAIKRNFEDAIGKEKILGIIAPNKDEAVCFDLSEIEALSHELSCGRISLISLAEELNLSDYHVRLVLDYLLKTNRIHGSLTFSCFISDITLKKAEHQKAKTRKLMHRRKMARKRP